MTTRMINGQAIVTYSTEELLAFVDFVLNHGKGVTNWEQQFMRDMQKHAPYMTPFSEKQAQVIERIYTERT